LHSSNQLCKKKGTQLNSHTSQAAGKPAGNKITVTISYDGVDEEIETNLNQAVQALLQHALQAFGTVPNAHTLGLYNAAGTELDVNKSVEDSLVRDGDRLILRTSQVRGG
jgi:hypothetical protein